MDENNEEVVSSQSEVETTASTTPATETPAGTPDDSAVTTPVASNEVPEKAQDDRPQYTELEKAQYSFKKQFSKQKAKYERQIAEMQRQWEERFDKLEHPEKYAPKTRSDFETDDEFINHLVDEKVQAILAQKLDEYQKQEDEQKKQSEVESQYKSRVTDNVSKLYPDEQSRQVYQEAVDNALKDGLGDVLEQDSELCQYIMLSPLGPKIMYELATNLKSVDELFGEGVTPIMRQFKIREIEAKLAAQPQPVPPPPAPTAVQTPKPAVVGQPGNSKENPTKDIFEDPKALRDFLRRP